MATVTDTSRDALDRLIRAWSAEQLEPYEARKRANELAEKHVKESVEGKQRETDGALAEVLDLKLDKSTIARELGMSRQTLYRRLERAGIHIG